MFNLVEENPEQQRVNVQEHKKETYHFSTQNMSLAHHIIEPLKQSMVYTFWLHHQEFLIQGSNSIHGSYFRLSTKLNQGSYIACSRVLWGVN